MDEFFNNHLDVHVNRDDINSLEEKAQFTIICNILNDKFPNEVVDYDLPLIVDENTQPYISRANKVLKTRGIALSLLRTFNATPSQVTIHYLFKQGFADFTNASTTRRGELMATIKSIIEMNLKFGLEPEEKKEFYEYRIIFLPKDEIAQEI